MAELAGTNVRQFVGKPVRVGLNGGRVVDGHLLSFDGRSLWMVTDGEDCFVPVTQVDLITLRSPAVPLAG
ncbi:MAG: LSm family protein [Acidimicrobiia bacterium]